MTDCLFCHIIAGDIPADIVARSTNVIAFRDIAPKAPLHVLVAPVAHMDNVAEAAASMPDVLAEMVTLAQGIADAECGGEFRLIFNTGASAGQSVFHVHGHVLGGSEFPEEGV